MTTPVPRPGILDIAPYVPGKSTAPGVETVYKLSSNESALGMSTAALTAFREAGETLPKYPDGNARALREAIAQIHHLEAEQIVCGAGSDELLQLLCRAYLGPGDNIVQSDHGFLIYSIAALSCGAQTYFAPETDLTADVTALVDACDENTKIVFIANPNNPTGTYISAMALRDLRAALRDDILLVIDAAYAEYMSEPDYNAGEDLVREYDNVVMTRTFSKIYGMGGLRVGWGYFPPAIADVLNRIRGPFNVSGPAMAAAVAALHDQDFVARNRAHNSSERAFLEQQLGGLGISFKKGFANFVLACFEEGSRHSASQTADFLHRRGVIVRELGAYKLPHCLRISIGSKEANRACIELLRELFSNE